ncbi:MAG TPA: SLC13 family permease [Ilumatobacteraceae bacterium]
MSQVLFLAAASASAMFPWRRVPAWVGPTLLAAIALATRLVPFSAARTASHDLANAIAFLLLAVPLAVLLDETGFFTALAERIESGRHLRLGLWVLAALVTVVFNLDAAVVLLTPLYVRVALRHDEDPVVLGLIPALLASLASSVLPVSNLTNLIAVQRLHLGTGAFVTHLALPSIVAVGVGAWVFLRVAPHRVVVARTDARPEPAHRDDGAAMRIGIPIVVFLLLGFTAGARVGIPAWSVAAIALIVLMVRNLEVPWRHVPFGAALLAAGLGVLATAAAEHLPIEHVLGIDGIPGDLATIGVMAVGANAVNNLPALLVTLPSLDHHHARVWSVLLGVNLGPTLWVTGALSTLLWQATMKRLGHAVTARTYVTTAARVGVPSLAAATAVHVGLTLLTR